MSKGETLNNEKNYKVTIRSQRKNFKVKIKIFIINRIL